MQLPKVRKTRRPLYVLCIVFSLLSILISSCGVSKSLKDKPDIRSYKTEISSRQKLSDTTFRSGSSFLTKNEFGLWELYVEGDPYERGMLIGELTQDLMSTQEDVFLSKIQELVPSKTKQYLLRKFLAWYNRKMYLHVPSEYKAELYGLSKYISPKYNDIAAPYLRALYLHGAHDIGHALQDLMLVGCTSFAAWGDKTEGGSLILGRNFDFYAGDGFAREKVISFINPDSGYKYMSYSWPGMIGVVSGMNEHGLTVTINAGKSDIPLVAKTPISIVTREILQYATTIKEATEIAKKREVFVSESILVGSAKDKKAVTIEVSPDNFGVYEVQNTSQLICTNHFQSEAYNQDKKNSKHILESHSNYRYNRLDQLLSTSKKVTPKIAVEILRNKEGLNNKSIGYGNEKALNQLLAHHGIVFKPEQREVWVSSSPYQLGAFVAYNLDEVFEKVKRPFSEELNDELQLIKSDPFLNTEFYKNYEQYRIMSREIDKAIQEGTHLSSDWLQNYAALNPDLWIVHYQIGIYNYKNKYFRAAYNAFEKSQSLEVTTIPDSESIQKYIKKSKRKAQL